MNEQRSDPMRSPRSSHPLATALAVTAGFARLLPHPPNFTPVGALGLFAGARLRPWQALVLPLVVMAAADLVLWATVGYPPFSPFVYGSLLGYVLIGRTLRRTDSPWRIGLASLLASAQFFVITNFGVWLSGHGHPAPLYPPTWDGLIACYAAAIPFLGTDAPPLGFLGNLVLADLSFGAVLFGVHAWLSRWTVPAERVAAMK